MYFCLSYFSPYVFGGSHWPLEKETSFKIQIEKLQVIAKYSKYSDLENRGLSTLET